MQKTPNEKRVACEPNWRQDGVKYLTDEKLEKANGMAAQSNSRASPSAYQVSFREEK